MFRAKIRLIVFKVSVFLSVFILSMRIVMSLPLFEKYEDPLTRERFAQFNCYKHKICTPGPPKVCGYNPASLELAEFEDLCTLYQVNCRKIEFFKVVDMAHCLSKKAFMAAHNDRFQFEHVNQSYHLQGSLQKLVVTTPAAATTGGWFAPGLVQLVVNGLFH